MAEHKIFLPYQKPPLTLNKQLHHHAKARLVKEVRQAAHWMARARRLPRNMPHAVITLHYVPRDKRTRDTDNLVATAKPAYDGLVDYGLVPDDNPQYMTKTEAVIHPPQKTAPGPNGSRLYLTITEKDAR